MSSDVSRRDGLTDLRVVKNCPAQWSRMRGTDQVRHCTHCSRNVYNLSEMSRQEAADLIEKTEGRLCIRYYARPDGTIMTADCPKPQLRKAKRLAWLSGLASVFGFVFFPVATMGARAAPPETMARNQLRHLAEVQESLKSTDDPSTVQELVQAREAIRTEIQTSIERMKSKN